MSSLVKGIKRGMALVPLAAFGALGASAQEASEVSAYVDNSYLFLIGGLIVMFMAAGFCMLEAGLVRKKNAAMQSMKNVALFSVAGIMFWLVGYNMAYPGATIAGGWFGVPSFIWSPADDLGTGYASASDWFFQMVFVATAASIVSGTVAERVKLWPFLIFTAFLTAFIYPIVASWEWGGGALDAQFAFSDFAGSTLVHSTGGWAALVGAIIIGPRVGKFVNGEVHPMPGSNIPLAALGTFILWFGWFGFNGASQLAAGTFDDINAVAIIFANTNMAACGGVLAAMILTAILYKGKVDATMAFNGAIGGLVSITAEPLMPSMGLSILIGAIGGVLVVLTVPLLDKLKIDDVVGAIPAHLVCGIWGTMIVPLSHGGGFGIDTTDAATPSYLGQFIGVLACGIFVSIASAVVWMALKVTIGVRPSEEEELAGMDKSEVGLEAYPEFG
ncbi:ammonium transporter [Henriciella mobilis]|uniref:ammonium transporter n=1 Tax=Henriciella mobilis TaxID=2305467 RepID=UPI000E66CE71|nr:ammonium transporter [Henriciella mobilis]RIJ17828.1 ammonium transporter [Henriciella mobilis]RIJ25359.1 ammonium transporter [Henriciella mobilis]